MFDIFEMHKKLVEIVHPSGYERPQAEYLAELAKPFVDEVWIDSLNNVFCHKKGAGNKVMVATHLDVVGFIVDYIDDKGGLNFICLGFPRAVELIDTRVQFANGVIGSINMRGNFEKSKSAAAMGIQNLYIDIGAKSKAEAETLVPVGSYGKYYGRPVKVGGGNVMGPYADDLAACAVSLSVMEQLKSVKCENDIYFVFTSQEENECKGSRVASEAVRPYFAIACDVTRAGDTPRDDKDPMAVALGEGPTIKIKDTLTISNPYAVEKLKKAADQAGVTYQSELLRLGGTDSYNMQLSGTGAYASCVSIPCRYIHTPVEMYNLEDTYGAAKILAEVLRMKL